MMEFGEIFDVALTTRLFVGGSLTMLATYAVAIIWLLRQPGARLANPRFAAAPRPSGTIGR